jgi:arginine exporter protein ArgO
MTDSLVTSVTTVILALVGVAIIAVILSKNSQTSSVVTSLGTAFTGSLGAAESPVTQSSGLSAVLG